MVLIGRNMVEPGFTSINFFSVMPAAKGLDEFIPDINRDSCGDTFRFFAQSKNHVASLRGFKVTK
ncbi:hypothetical protein JCM14469_15120 [Desulfatiferula olefinivorans]